MLKRSTDITSRALTRVLLLATTVFALATPTAATAQDGTWDSDAVLAAQNWVAPPQTIAEAVLAPRYTNVTLTNLSPAKTHFLDEIGDGPVTMDVFSKPFHELGGQFIDYMANRNRRLTIRNNVGIQIVSAVDGSVTMVDVPDGARVSNATWSPDGSRVAFFAHFEDGTHIYVADASDGDSRQITRRHVLATLVQRFEWTRDGNAIATVLVPENRPAMPMAPTVPTGPQVKRTEEGENALRTYSSLMETPHDENLLEWHTTGQLAVIDVENRRVSEVGEPTMFRSFDFSPDGEHTVVNRMVRPFSYIVPVSRFGSIEEIWDLDGTVLAELEVNEVNTGIRNADDDDEEEDETPRRNLSWREDGNGLSFLQKEAAPESDADEDETGDDDERPSGQKDRVMQWLPPFDDASAQVVYESDRDLNAVRYNEAHDVLFLASGRGQTTRWAAVYLNDPETEFEISEWNREEFYENPGAMVGSNGAVPRFSRFGGGGGSGTVLMSDDGESVYMAGIEYSEDPLETAPMAWLDRLAVRTGERERIFEGSNDGVSERLNAVIDPEAGRFVITSETPTQIEQSFLVAGMDRTQLTNNVDHTPDITNAPRERFVVERPDGFRFRVNVTLPPGYREGTRLPAMFWFYPREYENQEDYDEGARTYDKHAFPNFGTRSMDYLVRLGYAVVTPDAPIVGKAGQMNNNYEHDLRNNLAAVIDELDARELIDRKRLGLGGHSYGAFGTVNAMVHTPFFKAGIAGDGNYNRTLTPMAFQSERRWLWEAKDVYLGMSPFMHANNLTGALLMYHGLQDQNVGTAPDHAPRLFHALNGLNKDAAMYLYPFEDHGPATRETLLDLWARWAAWLDVHLMNPEGEDRRITSEDQQG